MTSTSELRLDSLVGALTWDGTWVALASEWKRAYVTLLRERLETVIQVDSSGLLNKAAELMSPEEVENLLLSPRVSWRLLHDLESDTVSAIQAEMLRALDQNADTSEGVDENCLEPGCLRLAELMVDSQSSYDCPSRESGELALARLPSDIEAPALVLFEEALGLLKRRAPTVHDFVQQMTTRVVLRSDVARQTGFASGSFRSHAGMTLIVNPHALVGNAPRLIDAVVHESIHAAIYMYEPVVTPLCRQNPNGLQVRSCWSGRMLTLDQYVQACFVWWGLLNLWSTWLILGRDEQAEHLLERAARGFTMRPVSALRQKIDESCLDDRTWTALLEIEEKSIVKANYPH